MSDPQPLSVAISELIARRGLATRKGTGRLADVWKAVAGERVSGHTHVVSLRDRTVCIAVDNSALLNELVSFQSGSLLAGLQKECPELKIRRLRFQLRSDSQGSH
ncbi:MAG: DUF721 domain-containing protein [Planctomycetaceae bacterium]|jgi:predicted nucleic acid-binding Zn ribbon protein